MNKQKIVFRNEQAPGDILMLTAAIRDLHRSYPNRFLTGVRTTAPELWLNNPYITPMNPGSPGVREVKVGYPLIHKSNQCGLHFIQGFIQDINKKLRLDIRMSEFRADVHWSDEELNSPLVEGRYWVIVSGGKTDFITKWWDPVKWQAVVDRLKDRINFVQIGGGKHSGGAKHIHPSLTGVTDLSGQTDLRQAFRICLHAEGILCPVTCFMHLAAALNKPCVVVAGGREHWTWEAYNRETRRRNTAHARGKTRSGPKGPYWDAPDPVNDGYVYHQFLHNVGQLDCCKTGGCWTSKVDPEPKMKKRALCKDVVRKDGHIAQPRCMDMIQPDDVVRAVESYVGNDCHPEPVKVQPFERRKYTMENVNQALRSTARTAEETPQPVEPEPVLIDLPAAPVSLHSDPKTIQRPDFPLPVTVCVLVYGDYLNIIKRCLLSLYRHTRPECFKLRLGVNAPSDKVAEWLKSFIHSAPNVERVYWHDDNPKKYPVMREMFHDPDAPLDTKWVCWLDDDSHVIDDNWLNSMAAAVGDRHRETRPSHMNGESVDWKTDTRVYPRGVHMAGHVFYYHFRGGQESWIREASWYTGRSFRLDSSKKPPKPKSDFATGGYWFVTAEAIRACDWPDARIGHNGGDIMMGEAVYQQGFGLIQHHAGVRISDAPRRGYNEQAVGE